MLIRERRRGGTHGSEYIYALIGNELIHISEIGKLIRQEDDEYIYELPSNAFTWLYIFSFSRSGYGSVIRCPPGNYVGIDHTKCPIKNVEEALDWLGDVNFKIKSPELRNLLNELISEYVTMASEAKDYWSSLGGKLRFMGHASRLSNFFNNPRIYYFTELSIPNDSGRIQGIRTTMSLVYENWVAVKISEALGARRLIRRSWEAKQPFTNELVTVWFEQGGGTSYAILDTPHGAFTIWLEFQVDPAIHVFPSPEYARESNQIRTLAGHGRKAVRPDIVIVRGRFDDVNDFIKSGKEIDALIECKALTYEDWRDDIDEQVIPYVKQFKPGKAMLVARHKIPSEAKIKMLNNGIDYIEDVELNEAGISKLMKTMKDITT
ncbi:MAG: hypothetical protein RXO22_09625 [Thermocladium sp.]|jgi:hypothetical protein